MRFAGHAKVYCRKISDSCWLRHKQTRYMRLALRSNWTTVLRSFKIQISSRYKNSLVYTVLRAKFFELSFVELQQSSAKLSNKQLDRVTLWFQ